MVLLLLSNKRVEGKKIKYNEPLLCFVTIELTQFSEYVVVSTVPSVFLGSTKPDAITFFLRRNGMEYAKLYR